jgi:hypothetical protein
MSSGDGEVTEEMNYSLIDMRTEGDGSVSKVTSC